MLRNIQKLKNSFKNAEFFCTWETLSIFPLLTEPFSILEPQNPPIDEFYLVRKRRWTDSV